MRDLDRETMELLGDFFLYIAVVPRSWVDQQPKPIVLQPGDCRGPDTRWWTHHECAIAVREFCDMRWVRVDPTGYYLRDDVLETSWSDASNHRVEIVEDDSGNMMEFTISIDIRTEYSDFLDDVIKMADSAKCDFFDFEYERFFSPSREIIIEAVQQHMMANVVFDAFGKIRPN